MKVSTTGYKRNSKDKKHKQLYIPGDVLTMLGVDDYVQATPQYSDGSLGQTTTMAPGVPRISFPGAIGVIENKLPQAQLGLIDKLYKRRILNQYPAMQNVYGSKGENLNIIRDRNFDASKHGFGDIEFVFPGSGAVNYSDNYTYQSPTPDKYTAVYNPKGAKRGDVFLDMLHGMRDDPSYQQVLQNFSGAVRTARDKDMDYFYNRDVSEGWAVDGRESWDKSYIDGMLRAELSQYAPGRVSGESDYKIERTGASPEMQDAAIDIYDYLRLRPKKLSEQQQGGPLPKAQTLGELKQQALEREQNRQQARSWDPNQLNGAQEVPTDNVPVRPMTIAPPAKNAPKKSKEQMAKEAAIKTNTKAQNDPALWLAEHPEYMLDADGRPVLKSLMEANAPEDKKALDIEKAKEEFVKDLNSDPLQQSLGTASLDNPVTNAAAERYADYTVNNIDPGKTEDQMFRGYMAPTTRDFYQPNNASNTVRGAAALGATAAGVAGLSAGLAYLPVLGEAAYAWGAANPFISATGAALTSSPTWAPGLSMANALNAGFITHGVSQLPETYEAWDNVINNGGSYQDAIGKTLLNGLDFAGLGAVEGFQPAFKYIGEGFNTAVKYPGQLYNDVATGNSMIPYAWKSPAVGLSQEASADMFKGLLNSGKLTPAERNLLVEYQFNSNSFTGRFGFVDSAKRDALNNIISKYKLQFPQNSNAIATRRFNMDKDPVGILNNEDGKVYFSGKGTLGANIEGSRINFGDRPTSFSAGVGSRYGGAGDRLVIPSRHLSKMENNFIVNDYSPLSQEQLQLFEKPNLQEFASKIGTNPNLTAEREIIGTGLDFKQIGKVKNDIGGFDYVVKPNNIKAGTSKSTSTTAEAFSEAAATPATTDKELVDLSKLPNRFNTNGSNADNLDFRRVRFTGEDEPVIIPYVKGTDIPFHKTYRQDMVSYFNSPQFHSIMDTHYPGVDKKLYKENILKNLESPLVYDPNFLSEAAAGTYYPHTSRSDLGKNVFSMGVPKLQTKVKYANTYDSSPVFERFGEQAGNSYVNAEHAVKHEYRHQATNSEELLPESLTKEDLLNNLTPEGKVLMEKEIAENKKYRVDNYYSKPTEFDVRIRRLKDDLKENGIVDYFNEPVTQEHIAQLLEQQKAYNEYEQVGADKLWEEFTASRREVKNNPNLTEAQKKEATDLLKEKFEKDADAGDASKPAPPKINEDTKDLLRYWSFEFLANKAGMLPAAIPVGIGIGVATQEKKKGGPVNKRNHKDLDNYFAQAWSKSRKTA